MVDRELAYLNQHGGWRAPAEKNRTARRKAGQFTEQVAVAIGNQLTHKFLVTVVYQAMEQECVALRQHSFRHL